MSEEIKNRVIEVMSRVFNVNKEDINIDFMKENFETWDSIGHLQLIMNLESDFKIKFRMEEINNIQGVKDCIELVEKYYNNVD